MGGALRVSHASWSMSAARSADIASRPSLQHNNNQFTCERAVQTSRKGRQAVFSESTKPKKRVFGACRSFSWTILVFLLAEKSRNDP